jgi:two-component system cell cycle response regulator CpdR
MKKTILIADAEPRLTRGLKRKLLDQNYEVLGARNLQDALERFDPRAIDLLLLDLDVPTRDGWSLLARIAELKPAPRVIALTERSDLAEVAARSCFSAVAEKPLHFKSLLRAIDEMVSQATSGRGFQYIPPAPAIFRQKVFAKAADPTCRPAVSSRWGINE